MGIFGRKKAPPTAAGIVPSGALQRLPDIGRAVFSEAPSHVDVSDFYLPGFLAAGSPVADPGWSIFVDQFVDELTHASNQIGGWAAPGAFYVTKDFVKSEDWAKPSVADLMDRALMFLVEVDADPGSIPNFALPRWTVLKQRG